MPAYNEAENIQAALEDVRRDVFSVVADAELIVLDDGSTDDTNELVQAMCAQDARVRLLRQHNAGHGRALRAGIDASTGDVLLLLDSDRQIGLEDFARHWQDLNGALIGVRRPRHDPASRLVITRAMRLLIRALFSQAPEDAGAPYKLIQRDLWEEVRPLIGQDSWIPSVLLAVAVQNLHPQRYRETTVRHLARRGGKSTLRLGRLARFCVHAAFDLFGLRKQIAPALQQVRQSARPARRQD